MAEHEEAFPTRLLRLGATEALGAAEAISPQRINQHIEGVPDGKRVMTDDEVARILNDPFSTLVLRRGRFPKNLGELLATLDEHNPTPEGLPDQRSFLIAEGGQIPFVSGVDKGTSRLIVVRSRANKPELMISVLLPPGAHLRDDPVLLEVIAWDLTNRTFHFFQRQGGAWFWCGQSDMALEEATRGHGPFDSHINGYPNMKELKTPWVHWHGPGLGIAETAYAPTDPLVADPLFTDKDNALNFETRVIRPLMQRWNAARFDKAVKDGRLTAIPRFMAQLVEATSANLTSTHTEFSRLAQDDLSDLPVTFFFDQECLVSAVGLQVQTPPLRMTKDHYRDLVTRHDLRVRGGSIDQPGDVPFCFVVPERAFEDVLVVQVLLQRGALSPRLAACLLMVDFPNPVGSARRAGLLTHMPDTCGLDAASNLDAVLPDVILATEAATLAGSAEREFADHWRLGADAWRDAFADRLEAYLTAVAAKLDTDAGCDDIFRLAESRRREFRKRPLAEFDLTLPRAVGIPDDAPILEMTPDATVQPRP
jgi:hypothetical protein